MTCFTSTKVQTLTLKLEAQAAGNSRAVASAAFALCVCTGDSAPARAAGFLERAKKNRKGKKKLSLLALLVQKYKYCGRICALRVLQWRDCASARSRFCAVYYSVYLLYYYKSTITAGSGARRVARLTVRSVSICTFVLVKEVS
jgi:hypothetical protein